MNKNAIKREESEGILHVDVKQRTWLWFNIVSSFKSSRVFLLLLSSPFLFSFPLLVFWCQSHSTFLGFSPVFCISTLSRTHICVFSQFFFPSLSSREVEIVQCCPTDWSGTMLFYLPSMHALICLPSIYFHTTLDQRINVFST